MSTEELAPEELSALLSSYMPDLPGYRVMRRIGRGGMSYVYLGVQVSLDRQVAIKVMAPEAMADEKSKQRFEQEARTIAKLEHPSIVGIHEVGRSPQGLMYYVLPYLAKGHLGQRDFTNDEARATEVLRSLLSALEYAHARGIVHRDIKPDNVLLSGGAAVVTDFGIAKALSAARAQPEGATLTQMGTSIGTPAYIAPEQAAGDPNVDHRADIYSFGCMAYELLAGRSPFADRTPQRMMAAHMAETPRPVAELRADVPEPLARLIMKCLEKEPSARPQSAAEVMTALDSISTSGASHSAMPAVLIGGRGMLAKALGVYAASFVAVAILAKAAIVGVGLPDWVFPGALIVMALGLPVILFTGYTQYVARRAIAATPTFTPNGSVSPATHGTMATFAMKASPHMSWRRSMFGGVYALGAFTLLIGVFMVLRMLGVGPFASLLTAGRLSAKAPVLIADFATTNTDSSLGAVVSDAVRAGLGQSSLISLVRPADVASTLRLMRRPPASRLDLQLAREVAARNGVQAIVDGTVTGVAGGYIIALRLVSADSGVELASFRETGDGPRGLIDAADKLARELRGKIGESFKKVQATPALASVTTSSLEALRAFSAAQRANNTEGNPVKAEQLWREAVRLDTSFAAAWTGIATALSNINGPRGSIDSAIIHAYANRGHLPEAEQAVLDAKYFAQGPHRDRGKAAAAYLELARTTGRASHRVNAGEFYRSWRDFATADSLNHVALAIDSLNSIAMINLVQLHIARGMNDSAEAVHATAVRRMPESPALGEMEIWISYAKGDYHRTQSVLDSMAKGPSPEYRNQAKWVSAELAVVQGQLARASALVRDASAFDAGKPAQLLRDSLALASAHAWFHGPNDADPARIDAALARYPLRTLAPSDRPYFDLIAAYAQAGKPDKARAMLATYRADITDTAMLRLQVSGVHNSLGEIALASNDPRTAITEFRKADVGSDGRPARECAACGDFNLARAFDAANMTDSTIAAYERFINAPYWARLDDVDPLGLAGAHKRLGELYEAKNDAAKAIPHYQRFIELWKNADPELQPLVADAKKRMARLTASERR